MDLMHVADCHGVANIIAASIIRRIAVTRTDLAPTQHERLDRINERMAAFYDRHPGSNRMPALRLVNLVKDGWSDLHGPVVKAANTRGLAPFLVELTNEFHSGADRYDVLVRRAALSLDRFYALLYGASRFLTDGQAAELRRVLARLGSSVQELRDISRARGGFEFKVSPKMHMILHMASLPANANPRFLQCYQEETHIGSITKIWHRSANGRYRATVQRMVLLKRLVATVVRLATDGSV